MCFFVSAFSQEVLPDLLLRVQLRSDDCSGQEGVEGKERRKRYSYSESWFTLSFSHSITPARLVEEEQRAVPVTAIALWVVRQKRKNLVLFCLQ